MHQTLVRPATVFLIRHAESEANVANDIIGGFDTPLSTHGYDQAAALQNFLQRHPLGVPRRLCASDMPRALKTAEFVAMGLGVPFEEILVDRRLREFSQGEWGGKPRAQVQTEEIRARIAFLGMDFRPPGGESMSDAACRGRDWLFDLNRVIEAEGVTTFVAVTHSMWIKALLQRLFNFDPRLAWLLEVANTSVTKIRCSKDGWHLEYLNATPHLPDRGL